MSAAVGHLLELLKRGATQLGIGHERHCVDAVIGSRTPFANPNVDASRRQIECAAKGSGHERLSTEQFASMYETRSRRLCNLVSRSRRSLAEL